MANFNANEHMTKIKGKDYLEVKWRLVWFRQEHPDWNIDTTLLAQDDTSALFAAKIYDQTGKQVSSGHGSESTKDWGDYVEKAETKAIGRALAVLGIIVPYFFNSYIACILNNLEESSHVPVCCIVSSLYIPCINPIFSRRQVT